MKAWVWIASVVGIGAVVGVLFLMQRSAFVHPVTITPVTKSTPSITHPNPFTHIPLTAQSAIVVDLTNGETLFSQKADEQLPLASLTKLLTLYAATGILQSKSPVPITDTAIAQEGDTGLHAGETFSFMNLAKLTLVASSNDGAEAIAEAAQHAQSIDVIQLLASAVQGARLTNTYALNGTGLDENLQLSGAYGTARDITKLAKAFLDTAPEIAHATTLQKVSITDLKGIVHTEKNTNQEVTSLPGPLLSKTGYTDLAGGNLVVVFDVGMGHPIAIAVLGSTHDDRFTDVTRLTNATLAHFAYAQSP
jgi:D-alanyl-D-alanine carboxypeptidase (penicillin-binding protein 5/6)